MAIRTLLGLVLAFFLATNGLAQGTALAPGHPDSYVVQKGDTLWDISGQFLREPWRWPEIWQVNPQIENPHLIYPGDTISLSYDASGKPRLSLKRGPRPTERLSPQVRELPLDRAIPTIPIDVIHPFLTRPLVLETSELDTAPYIVMPSGEHLMGAAGQNVYVQGLQDANQQDYTVVRQGDTFVNPDNPSDILGYEAIYVADSELRRFATEEASTIYLVDGDREARIGDRVIPPSEVEFDAHFMPHAPEKDLEGYILNVHDGVNQVGRFSIIAMSLGEQDGVRVGDVFRVWQAGRTVRDDVAGPPNTVRLPAEPAGAAMVFRTFNRVSYALIMRARTNIRVGDKVKTPEFTALRG